MSDRELLELAAKAAGLKVISYSEGYGCGIEGDGVWWNPLENDGQAVRLAAMVLGRVEFVFEDIPDESIGAVRSVVNLAATRRAIVRAAAMVMEMNE